MITIDDERNKIPPEYFQKFQIGPEYITTIFSTPSHKIYPTSSSQKETSHNPTLHTTYNPPYLDTPQALGLQKKVRIICPEIPRVYGISSMIRINGLFSQDLTHQQRIRPVRDMHIYTRCLIMISFKIDYMS